MPQLREMIPEGIASEFSRNGFRLDYRDNNGRSGYVVQRRTYDRGEPVHTDVDPGGTVFTSPKNALEAMELLDWEPDAESLDDAAGMIRDETDDRPPGAKRSGALGQTRREILDWVVKQARPVTAGEVAKRFRIANGTASSHLKTLVREGRLVQDRDRGPYRLPDPETESVAARLREKEMAPVKLPAVNVRRKGTGTRELTSVGTTAAGDEIWRDEQSGRLYRLVAI